MERERCEYLSILGARPARNSCAKTAMGHREGCRFEVAGGSAREQENGNRNQEAGWQILAG